MPYRRKSEQSLTRLFQGYVNDYGNAVGEKIIYSIIFNLGGLRLTISMHSHDSELLYALREYLQSEFGESSGNAIMDKLVLELGGQRISFPNFRWLHIQERNKKICEMSGKDSVTISELALKFNLSDTQVWRIVNEH